MHAGRQHRFTCITSSRPANFTMLFMYQAFKLGEHLGYSCSKAAEAAPHVFEKIGGAFGEMAPIVAREILKAHKDQHR
jgi:hypothetical protein